MIEFSGFRFFDFFAQVQFLWETFTKVMFLYSYDEKLLTECFVHWFFLISEEKYQICYCQIFASLCILPTRLSEQSQSPVRQNHFSHPHPLIFTLICSEMLHCRALLSLRRAVGQNTAKKRKDWILSQCSASRMRAWSSSCAQKFKQRIWTAVYYLLAVCHSQ